MRKPKLAKIDTIWDLRTYDVWGNAKEGYEVNDSSIHSEDVHILLEVKTYNAGLPGEFKSAYPTDSQIRKAFGFTTFRMDLTGDDTTIYINAAVDSMPMGEMHCTSHESLSPIRAKTPQMMADGL